jgi:hypothetical protein
MSSTTPPTKGNLFPQDDCPFKPSQRVPHAGLYAICHADEERATVVFTKDEIFPQCRQCGEKVRYKLLHAAPHISEDPDFAESAGDNPASVTEIPIKQFPRQLGAAHGFRYWQEPLSAG